MRKVREGELLRESLAELARARGHLEYSFRAVARLDDALENVTEEDLEAIEAFTSRFSRLVDLVTKRVLRALDQFELYDTGTLLDVANRAEQRGVIDSVDWLREVKDLRNRSAHDYAGDRLAEIFVFAREELRRLLAACDRLVAYSQDPFVSSGAAGPEEQRGLRLPSA